MEKFEIEALSELTAHERHKLTDISTENFASRINEEDVRQSVIEVAALVNSRFHEGKEISRDFGVIAVPLIAARQSAEKKLGKSDITPAVTFLMNNSVTQMKVVEPLNTDETVRPENANLAAAKALLCGISGKNSGEMTNSQLSIISRYELSNEFLDLNIPGAVVIGDMVFSVHGLHPDNNEEAALAIGLGCLESIQLREVAIEAETLLYS
jgi:hypothetical protein